MNDTDIDNSDAVQGVCNNSETVHEDTTETDDDSTTSEEIIPSKRIRISLVPETQRSSGDLDHPKNHPCDFVPETPLPSNVDSQHLQSSDKECVQTRRLESTQLQFGYSGDEWADDGHNSDDSDETIDGHGEEFSGTFTRTQRRQMQLAIQESLLASQAPATPRASSKPNTTLLTTSSRRSPRLAAKSKDDSQSSVSKTLTASAIAKHLSASKAMKSSGTQLSLASFLMTSKQPLEPYVLQMTLNKHHR